MSLPHRPTLLALGVFAFTIKATVHEWVGHGGAAGATSWSIRCSASATGRPSSRRSSTFGGCAWMVWIAFDPLTRREEVRAGVVERSHGWIAAGVLCAVFLLALLGPSIRFS